MARSRNIKPGFFANDLLAEVPPLGRLLFAGIWTIADREGRLEDRSKKIKAQIFPYDDCDVDALLDELARRSFIERYQVNGIRVIQITNWHKHQNPHVKEPASTLPAPDQHGASTGLAQGGTDVSTSSEPIQDGPASFLNQSDPMPAQERTGAVPMPAPGEPETSPVQMPDGSGSGPADSGFLIPDSRFLIPDSPAPNPDSPFPIPDSGQEQAPASDRPEEAPSGGSDSEQRKVPTRRNSEMQSLKTIAERIGPQFSPEEVAGYIMAHFPMQHVDRLQRPMPGDSGLTVDQVNCIARHGCTFQNAKTAFEHFKEKQSPINVGAWAFHCLKDELSQDARIDLREETRSAQRSFKERTGEQRQEEPQQGPTEESTQPGALSQ